MRRPLVAGNWKMNGTLASVAPLVEGIKRGTGSVRLAEVVVCPPFVYLHAVAEGLADAPVALGAQNLCTEASGAYTGEVSGTMLRDYNCEYVIVGHSERRAFYAETDEQVTAKFARAQSCGLRPILCVGEDLEDREAGRMEAVVTRQLLAVLDTLGVQAFGQAVVAYEPVWAIGTGRTATPEQAQEVHQLIRGLVAEREPQVAAQLRVLYGGSVNAENAAALFAMNDIDGGLVGGASLKADEFMAICRAVE